MPKIGFKKRLKDLEECITSLNFTCKKLELKKKHIKCYIIDNEGNEFFVVTGLSCSGSYRNKLLNFKQDIRRESFRRKGLL